MKVVTICGSMRFAEQMKSITYDLETKYDFCVLQPVYSSAGKAINKSELDKIVEAHYKKIDISDAVYVVNIDGYIGKSVSEEIEYARHHSKQIIYHENGSF